MAYLFVPNHKIKEKLPAIVAIYQDSPNSHLGGLNSTEIDGDKEMFYALELFNIVYIVVCPDRL